MPVDYHGTSEATRRSLVERSLRKKRGDSVDEGEAIAEIHARDDASAAEAVGRVRAAYDIGDDEPRPRSIVLDTIG